jgi:hypothetical protein
MARFRNIESGSVVSVDDEKAARFTTGWEPLDEKPKRAPGRPKKTEDSK